MWRRPSRKVSSCSIATRTRPAPPGSWKGFKKDFPKINTSYVRAQTGALYNKIVSERSAGRFDVDVIQLSDLAPAVDFQKKGGYEHYVSPETLGLQGRPSEFAGGLVFLDRRRSRRHRLQLDQGLRRGCAEDVAGHSQSALEGLDQLQDLRLRPAVRAVVHAAQAVWARASGRSSPSRTRTPSIPASSCSTGSPRATT